MKPESAEVICTEQIRSIPWKDGFPFRKYLKKSVFLFLIFLTLIIYWILASIDPQIYYPNDIPLHRYRATGYYTRLTEAFLNGQLSFLEKPDISFLQLKDPYDPQYNLTSPYRLHDASLYEGKWYMYFGVTPVFLLWLPAKLLGFSMREGVATALFCWGGLLASLGFIRNITQAHHISIDRMQWLMFILLLSFSNGIPVMIKRSLVYETSITCAYFCLMCSFYFYSFCFLKINELKKFFYISGIFLSLSILSRFSYIIFSLFFILMFFYQKDKSGYSFLRKCFLFFISTIIVISIQGFYNYFRFNSFFEFGVKYQLAGVKIDSINILSHLNFYSNISIFFNEIAQIFGFKIGILQLSPFFLFLIFNLLCFFYRKNLLLKTGFSLFLTAFSQFIFLSFLFPGVSIRYIIDFSPIFILSSIICFIFLNNCLIKNRFIFSLSFLVTLYGSVLNLISFPT